MITILPTEPFLVAYFAYFWILTILLTLNPVPAYAEWVRVGENDNVIAYADPDTISTKGKSGEDAAIIRLEDRATVTT